MKKIPFFLLLFLSVSASAKNYIGAHPCLMWDNQQTYDLTKFYSCTNPDDDDSVSRDTATIEDKGESLENVTKRIGDFLTKYYEKLGTPILWNAKIDTSLSTSCDLLYKITYISSIVSDEGFFEYHKIHIHVGRVGERISITSEFKGAYGSGIILPPRERDYKPMKENPAYAQPLNDYVRWLFSRIREVAGKR